MTEIIYIRRDTQKFIIAFAHIPRVHGPGDKWGFEPPNPPRGLTPMCNVAVVCVWSLDAVRSATMNVSAVADTADCSLECWSDGNPAPRYSWLEYRSNGRRTTVTGNVYHVHCTDGVDDDGDDVSDVTVQCLASNSVALRPHVAASSNLTIRPNDACCRTFTAAFREGVLAVLQNKGPQFYWEGRNWW